MAAATTLLLRCDKEGELGLSQQENHPLALPQNPKQRSPLVLAYIGDAVFELMVRERLLAKQQLPLGKLHRASVSRVCATAQSQAVEQLLDVFTPEEMQIYKRGRNATGGVPKNADLIEYRRATGLEAVFGYLHLCGQDARMRELFDLIWKD